MHCSIFKTLSAFLPSSLESYSSFLKLSWLQVSLRPVLAIPSASAGDPSPRTEDEKPSILLVRLVFYCPGLTSLHRVCFAGIKAPMSSWVLTIFQPWLYSRSAGRLQKSVIIRWWPKFERRMAKIRKLPGKFMGNSLAKQNVEYFRFFFHRRKPKRKHLEG